MSSHADGICQPVHFRLIINLDIYGIPCLGIYDKQIREQCKHL